VITVSAVRSQALGWAGRKYLARRTRHGLDLSKLGFLPGAALMPLHRTGVDPVTLAHADNPTRRSARAHNLGGIP